MQSALSLDDLSEDEQARIWKVLQRDESLRRKNNVKVGKLKGELYGLRMKGILRDGDDLSRLCVRCHCELGIIFNKGEICPSCRFKICKTCRVALISGGWTCIYCFKQMQLKWLSGEWIRPQVQRQSINRRLSGSDLVRSAFTSDSDSLSDYGSTKGNAGKAVTEEIRRAITNGSGPPSSEDLERTSSFESSPVGASTLHDAEVERVGFPSESDSFRLSRLIGSYANKSTSSEEKERVCIKRATSRPYRDSDSDSSSSTATSPVLSKARQSLAKSTPSLNTATTPEHGSKKDLRSNKKSADSRGSNSPGADFVLGRQISSSSGQSISPSELAENCQNGRRTSTRSGNLSNASSKTRLLDLAVYSSKKNLSASTDSGQAPLSLQADTGSETELCNQSQSSGSRTKLSSDASDNETPIDTYFMDHLSKEEELKQSKLTEDVYCSDPLDLRPSTEGLAYIKDESGDTEGQILPPVEIEGSGAKCKDSNQNEDNKGKEGVVNCFPGDIRIRNNSEIGCDREGPNLKTPETGFDLCFLNNEQKKENVEIESGDESETDTVVELRFDPSECENQIHHSTEDESCSIYNEQNRVALEIEPGNELKADTAVELRFDPSECEGRMQHDLINNNNNSKNKSEKSPENNKSTTDPEIGNESADLTASLSEQREPITLNSNWTMDQEKPMSDFTNDHSPITDPNYFDQRNRETMIDENSNSLVYINGSSENSCEDDRQELYANSDHLGNIDPPDWKSGVIRPDDRSEMIELFEVDRKEYFLDDLKIPVEYKRWDQVSWEYAPVPDNRPDAEKPKNSGRLEPDIGDEDSRLLEDQFLRDQLIPEPINSCNDELQNQCPEEQRNWGSFPCSADCSFDALDDESPRDILNATLLITNTDNVDLIEYVLYKEHRLDEGDDSEIEEFREISGSEAMKENSKDPNFDSSQHHSDHFHSLSGGGIPETRNDSAAGISAEKESVEEVPISCASAEIAHLNNGDSTPEINQESSEEQDSSSFTETEVSQDSSLTTVGSEEEEQLEIDQLPLLQEQRTDISKVVPNEFNAGDQLQNSSVDTVLVIGQSTRKSDWCPELNKEEQHLADQMLYSSEEPKNENISDQFGRFKEQAEFSASGETEIPYEHLSLDEDDQPSDESQNEVPIIDLSLGSSKTVGDSTKDLTNKFEEQVRENNPNFSSDNIQVTITEQLKSEPGEDLRSSVDEERDPIADQGSSSSDSGTDNDAHSLKSPGIEDQEIEPQHCFEEKGIDRFGDLHFLPESDSVAVDYEHQKTVTAQEFPEVEPRFNQDESEGQIHDSISKFPECNDSTMKLETGSRSQELIPLNFYWKPGQGATIEDFTSNPPTITENGNLELYTISDSIDDHFSKIDPFFDSHRKSEAIIDTGLTKDRSDMIELFSIDRKEYRIETTKSCFEYKRCDEDSISDAEEPTYNDDHDPSRNTSEKDVCSEKFQHRDPDHSDQMIPESVSVLDSSNEESIYQEDFETAKQLIDSQSCPTDSLQNTAELRNSSSSDADREVEIFFLEDVASKIPASEQYPRELKRWDSSDFVESSYHSAEMVEAEPNMESLETQAHDEVSILEQPPNMYPFMKNELPNTSSMEKGIENEYEKYSGIGSLVEPDLSKNKEYLPEESLPSSHQTIPEIEHLGEPEKSSNMDTTFEKISSDFQNKPDSKLHHKTFPEESSEPRYIPPKKETGNNVKIDSRTNYFLLFDEPVSPTKYGSPQRRTVRNENYPGVGRQDKLCRPNSGELTMADSVLNSENINRHVLPVDGSSSNAEKQHDNSNLLEFQSDPLTERVTLADNTETLSIDLVSGALNVVQDNDSSLLEQSENSEVQLGQASDGLEFRIQPRSEELDILPGDTEKGQHDFELEPGSSDFEASEFDFSVSPEGNQSSCENNEINKEISKASAVLLTQDDTIGNNEFLTVAQTSLCSTSITETEIDFPSVELEGGSLEVPANQTTAGKTCNEMEASVCLEKDSGMIYSLQNRQAISPVGLEAPTFVGKSEFSEFSAESTVDPQYVECQDSDVEDPYMPLFNDALDLKKVHFGNEDLNLDSPELDIKFGIRGNTMEEESFLDQTFCEVDSGNSDPEDFDIIDPISGRYSSENFFQEADPLDEMGYSKGEVKTSQELPQIPNSSLVSHSRHFLEAIPEQVSDDSMEEEEPEMVFLKEPTQPPAIPNTKTDSPGPTSLKSQQYETEGDLIDVGFRRVTYTVTIDDEMDDEFWGRPLFPTSPKMSRNTKKPPPVSPIAFTKNNNRSLREMNDKMYSGTCLTTDIDSVLDLEPPNPSRPCQLDISGSSRLDPKESPLDYKSPCGSGSSEISLLEYSPTSTPNQLPLDSDMSPMSPLQDPTPFGSLRDMILEDERLARERWLQSQKPKKKPVPKPDRHQKTLASSVPNEKLWQNNERNSPEQGKPHQNEPMATPHATLQLGPVVSVNPPTALTHYSSPTSGPIVSLNHPTALPRHISPKSGPTVSPHPSSMPNYHISPELGASMSLEPSPVLRPPKSARMNPHMQKNLPHLSTNTAKPSPLDVLPSLSKEHTLPHQLSNRPSKYPGDSKKKVSSPNKDALTDVNESHTYSGGGGSGGGGGGGRDDLSDSSSLHTTPEHYLNGNKRKVDLDASLPSITISEAEGSVSARDESEEENNDYLKGSQQSFRSGQSMTSSLGFTSSMVAEDDIPEEDDEFYSELNLGTIRRSPACMGSRDSLSSYYSNAGEINYGKINVTGDIQFGLDYDYKTVCLEIRIKQCRDLAPADMKKNRSDPYVKSYLLPDKSKTGKRKTKVKKNTLNPVFDEILRYSIAKSELENRTLWLTVWHNDRFGRNDFLGEVTIPFDYYRFEGPTLKWYSLQQRQEFTPSSLAYKGELSISLKYVSVGDVLTGSTTSLKQSQGGGRSPESGTGGQLHVFIKEARNLTAVRSGGYSDPFCKGYLLPEKNRSSKQKTPVVKKNCNPVWNHLFIFEDVSAHELSDRCLELTLWDYDRLSSNDFLGGIRLNLGSGIFGRKYVDWMDASGAEVSLWQSMMSSPNTWVDGTLILRANMNNRK